MAEGDDGWSGEAMNLKWLKEGRHPLWLFAALLVLVAVMALTGGQGKDTASQEEKRMAEVLSAMAGAGKVEVALFYDKAQADAFGGGGAGRGGHGRAPFVDPCRKNAYKPA